jgi:hypothetical protein
MEFFDAEVGAGGEELGSGGFLAGGLGAGVGGEVGDGEGFVEVEFAGAAVVVEAVGDVGDLLDFAEDEAGADGVDGSGGDEERLAGGDGAPVEEGLDFAREGGLAEASGWDGFAKAEGDGSARFGAEDVPHFGFAEGRFVAGGEGVVGVDLDGEFFAGEEEFDEQRKGRAFGVGEPDLADFGGGVGEPGFEAGGSPDFFFEIGAQAPESGWRCLRVHAAYRPMKRARRSRPRSSSPIEVA